MLRETLCMYAFANGGDGMIIGGGNDPAINLGQVKAERHLY